MSSYLYLFSVSHHSSSLPPSPPPSLRPFPSLFRNHLEGLIFQVKHEIEEGGLKGKLPQEEEEGLKKVLDDTQEWFDSNPGAEKDEIMDKAGELEKAFIGAREKVPASGGEEGGEAGPEGGSEGAAGAAGEGGEEPEVEEVD